MDCAFSKNGDKIIAAAVVIKLPEFELIENVHATRKVTFPYIPGLLSFREAPVCIAAVQKLQNRPDIFIIDGQGIAHPRRLGLAAHLGLFFDKPIIGCAKSRLTGQFDEPQLEKGKYTPLKDGEEVNMYRTDPLKPDTDAGSVDDFTEINRGTNPLNPDDDVVKMDVPIVLEGITFETGKWDVTPESEIVLQGALQTMTTYKDIIVEISGHTEMLEVTQVIRHFHRSVQIL